MSDYEPLFSNWDRQDRSSWWGMSDYRQTNRIYALEDDLAHARAAQSRATSKLRSDMSKMTKVAGSLEQRLDRLTSAFDAFVELTEVRRQLAVYDTAAAVRLRAKQVIVGVGGRQEVPGVEGYWLVPALRALYATREGRDATALLAEATAMDPRRAALFHVLTAAQFGRGEAVTTEQLSTAFGGVNDKITLAQRALWTLAADGHYGLQGRLVVQRKLTDYITGLDEAARDRQVTRWCTAVRPEPSTRKLPEEHQGKKLGRIFEASDRLAVLCGWVTEMLADRPARTAEPDEAVRHALELLVDEGSAAEAPLLARERELRRIVAGGEEQPLTWEHPIGEPVAMITADVEADDHPERAALAIRVSGPFVLAAAERLAEQAAEPVAAELRVKGRRGGVIVTRSGLDLESVNKAVNGIADYEIQRSGRKQQRTWAIVVAVAFLALGLLAWGFALVAVVPIGAAVWFHLADRKARAEAAELERSTREKIVADGEEQARRFAAVRTELDKRRPGLQDDVTTIKSLVG